MNDTPGWASPGSAPSDGQEPGASGPAEPTDRPGPAERADQPGPDPQDSPGAQSTGSQWSKEQPPPAQWSAPTGPAGPARPPATTAPGPGWGPQPPPGPGGHGAPGPGGYPPYGTPGYPAGEAVGAVPRPPPSPASSRCARSASARSSTARSPPCAPTGAPSSASP